MAAIRGPDAKQREELQEQSEVNTTLRRHHAQLHSRNEALEAPFARLEMAILRESELKAMGTD